MALLIQKCPRTVYVYIQPLQIKSVIAKEGLKGFIYIEAFKQTHVKQAIEGISSLRMGLFNQKVTLYTVHLLLPLVV
jgi:hypothetical protein